MKKRLRKIPTAASLTRAALDYLGRFAASEASLRRVLINRMRRAAMDNPVFAIDDEAKRHLHSVIETIVAIHKKTGALNDAAFAETKINTLRRQGRSRRAIQQRLGAKGIRGETLSAALAKNDDGNEPEEVELKAALTLARRRKLGPFRRGESDADKQRKDFAVLARAGFSSAIARKVLQTEPEEEWED